jgi:hypothetical protein
LRGKHVSVADWIDHRTFLSVAEAVRSGVATVSIRNDYRTLFAAVHHRARVADAPEVSNALLRLG